MTRTLFAAFATLALFLALPGAVLAGDFSGTGEVVEMGCYAKGQHGEGHASCAKRCLGNGAEMGLLDADGNITKLAAGADKAAYEALIELAGKQAKVEGVEKDGTVQVTASKPAA